MSRYRKYPVQTRPRKRQPLHRWRGASPARALGLASEGPSPAWAPGDRRWRSGGLAAGEDPEGRIEAQTASSSFRLSLSGLTACVHRVYPTRALVIGGSRVKSRAPPGAQLMGAGRCGSSFRPETPHGHATALYILLLSV
jgi:hypothetical protein